MSGTAEPLPTLCLAVATYRRPAELARLLLALVQQLADAGSAIAGSRVVVVDNDPAGSARAVVTDSATVRYVAEPEPGIAAARNRALDEARDDDLLVFIDDDEEPHAGWLVALLETRVRAGAAAVAGAVVSAYDGELDAWLRAGDFFRRRRLPTGTEIDVAATNNLLLDLRVVRRLGLRFDADFGISGGSDTLFTRALTGAGERMVWCDEAIVTDWVPTARLTHRWVLARAYRLGNSTSRVDLALQHDAVGRLRAGARAMVRGSVRVAGGAARVVFGLVTGSLRHRVRGQRTVARGLGMVNGAVGRVYLEYRRAG